VSLVASCVPSQVETNRELLTGGLIGRFMFAYGVEKSQDKPMPEGLSDLLKARIHQFYEGILKTPQRNSQYMRFTEGAWRLYCGAFARHCAIIRSMKEAEDSATYRGRWRVRVFKLAMLLQLFHKDIGWPALTSEIVITEKTLIAAMQINAFLDRGFDALFGRQYEADGDSSRNSKLQNRIIKYIKANASADGVPHYKLYLFLQEASSVVQPNIDALVEAKALIIKKVRRPGSRKAGTHYFIPAEKDKPTYEQLWAMDKGTDEKFDGTFRDRIRRGSVLGEFPEEFSEASPVDDGGSGIARADTSEDGELVPPAGEV